MPFRPLPLALLVLFSLVLTACTQTINVYPAAEPTAVPSVAPAAEPESKSPAMQHGEMSPAGSEGEMDHGGIGSGSMMGMMEQEETDHDAMMVMLSEGGMDSAAMMEMLREHSMDHEAMMGMMDMHSMDDGDMMDMMSEGDVDHAAMMEMMAQGVFDRDAMMDMMHKHGMDHDAMMGMMAALNTAVQEEEETAMDHDQPGDPALPFDAHFIDGMIEHHQGAVAMAQLALAEAEHEDLRTMAGSIIEAQQAEIEQMQTWRAEWHPDLPPTTGLGIHMGDMAVSADTAIPFDQRFLTAMISHHRGAITMAEAAQTQAEHDELRHMAGAIIAAQESEIAQMEAWLAEWYGIEPASADASGNGPASADGQADGHENHH